MPICLFMAIYNHIWPYMAIYGYIWQYMSVFGHIWAYMAIYFYILPYMSVFVHIWSYLYIYIYIYGHIWLYIWQYICVHGHIWLHMAIYGHIWPYMAIYGLVANLTRMIWIFWKLFVLFSNFLVYSCRSLVLPLHAQIQPRPDWIQFSPKNANCESRYLPLYFRNWTWMAMDCHGKIRLQIPEEWCV